MTLKGLFNPARCRRNKQITPLTTCHSDIAPGEKTLVHPIKHTAATGPEGVLQNGSVTTSGRIFDMSNTEHEQSGDLCCVVGHWTNL